MDRIKNSISSCSILFILSDALLFLPWPTHREPWLSWVRTDQADADEEQPSQPAQDPHENYKRITVHGAPSFPPSAS